MTPRRLRLEWPWPLLVWAAAIPSILAGAPAPTSRPPDPVVHALRPSADAVSEALRLRLATSSGLRVSSAELHRLYDAPQPAALWVDGQGRPSHAAREGLGLLGGAGSEGMNPHDYDAAGLGRRAAALDAAQKPPVEEVVAFDVALSATLLRYFRHLHLGRVGPTEIGFRVRMPDDSHDFVPLLRSAAVQDRVGAAAADLAPALAQYRALRAALAKYRALGATGVEAPPQMAASVRPGDPYPHLATLTLQLAALGDLPPDAAPGAGSSIYDGAIVTAVKAFQLRHGLLPDGVLGRATVNALRVPIAWRIRQIELALERLRWLPDLGRERFIVLNIPMFTLWAWDSIPANGAPSFAMRAIVGRALNTETPVFVETMRHVVFRPYWNVPRSILRNEILPILARDPDYMRRNEMEMVRGQGDDAGAEPNTAENRALLKKGVLRLRQRPGPRNSLGLVKFVFPNDLNVYMHGTPAQALFARSRRDFSHGCVRVEDPAALAGWVLQKERGWTEERILGAMAGTNPQRVDLSDPIQVILFYVTAVVMPDSGSIHFAEDIYRHDLRLDRALAAAAGP